MPKVNKLTSDLIYGFTSSLLLDRFDQPRPIPQFHKELWDLFCSDERYVAIAAPRGHAKSTAITHSSVLASVLFRFKTFVIIVSDTEGQAVQFLGDIKKEVQENKKLIDLFNVHKVVKDTESDLIVSFTDGHEFRIMAKGSEQKVRGIKWRNKRPDLIVCDDLENDEIVLNEERRAKFRQWFFQALMPSGSDEAHVRIVGTIIHLDSLLERLMPSWVSDDTVDTDLKTYSRNKKRAWLSVKYRAHPGPNDYSSILWPEKFPQHRLERIRRLYQEQGDLEGYSQEYLNNPIDEGSAYFRKEDFLPVETLDEYMDYYTGVDLAISEKDKRAFTAIITAGLNSQGVLKVVDCRRFRTADAFEIIDEIFSVHKRYKPQLITIEQENIARAIGSVLDVEQRNRQLYLNLNPSVVTQDKVKRARSIQARMRAGQVQFHKDTEWFPALHEEMLQFPKGKYADQVDALAHIGLTIDSMVDVPTPQEIEEEEYQMDLIDGQYKLFEEQGMDPVTGY